MKWLLTVWRFLWRPYVGLPFIVLAVAGLTVGAMGATASFVAVHMTSTNDFCSSCHAQNAVPEWQESIHFSNKVGFVAGCSDCHEPKAVIPLLARKVQSLNEVWHQMLGTINTPEKYEAHRLAMAQEVWDSYRSNNSQECRNCHQFSSMSDPDNASIRDMHKAAFNGGQNCVDCHKGVAHIAPDETPSSTDRKN